MCGKAWWLLLAVWLSAQAGAAVEVLDDRGKLIKLSQPAQRIISLAPHVTELLFAAGAGDKIVGVVDYSNHPEAAKKIPNIGAYDNFDYERIKQLKPDLIVGWQSGNPAEKIAHLETLGFVVFLSEPRTFAGIASAVERFGQLSNNTASAHAAASEFTASIEQLRKRYRHQAKVSLFYEIWNAPLMTLNGEHLFNQVAELCGANNVFASLPQLAPQISEEAVLAANPQMILASGMDANRPEWLDKWRRWPQLQAVKNNHLYAVHPDLLQRQSLRIADGAQQVCAMVDQVRKTANKR